MTKLPLLAALVVILLATLVIPSVASAQTPNYTQSKPYNCNQQVCNGLPLDTGGTWQFIPANGTFSTYSTSDGFEVCGNAASASCPGGISDFVENMPFPPRINNAVGGQGQITFNWTGEDPRIYATTGSVGPTHSGHVVAYGYETTHCFRTGCWYTLTVVSAQIFIN